MSADIHTLTGAYAVDALEPDERELFEAHLDACEPCRQEVAELQATAARLGAAEAMTPPVGLRDAVLGRLDDVRQEPPRSARPDVLRPSTSRRWLTAVLAPAAAVAAIAVIALAVVVAGLSDRVQQVETASTQVRDVVAAPDARIVDIETPAGEAARVVVSPSRNEAVFLADGMSAAPQGQSYVLWLIHDDGHAEPEGTLAIDDRGRATRVLAGDLATAVAIGVTMEPADEPVREPTSDPLMVADLAT